MFFITAGLFILGLCAGSFVNALVWRVREQSKKRKKFDKSLSILRGRSICPKCHHHLEVIDLIPLASWAMLGGKCRYCNRPIPKQYPIVELATALVFAASYIFWPAELEGSQWIMFITWLLVATGLMALLVYDYRWMLLPNRILYPVAGIAVVGRVMYISLSQGDRVQMVIEWGLSVAVASGFFWLVYQISRGRWIGFGDVRLGLITGTLLASPAKSGLMIFTASILGTLFVLPALLSGKRRLVSKIPFGPFLIVATFLVLLFGQPVIDWYVELASF